MIINIINKYEDYSDFIKENNCCYKYIKAHKLEYLLINLKRNKIYWNVDIIIDLVDKYKNYSKFLKENNNCYKYIKKHKLEYLLFSLNRNNLVA